MSNRAFILRQIEKADEIESRQLEEILEAGGALRSYKKIIATLIRDGKLHIKKYTVEKVGAVEYAYPIYKFGYGVSAKLDQKWELETLKRDSGRFLGNGCELHNIFFKNRLNGV